MRIELAASLILMVLPTFAQLGSSGDLHILTSNPVTEKRWGRTFVTVDKEGNIHGDSGKVGSGAANAAIGQLAESVGSIADASRIAVTNSMAPVYAVTNQMAQNAYGIVFHMAPSQSNSNLVSYVVKTVSDGTTDTQYVWYSQELTRPLVRYVKYKYYGGEAVQQAEWVGNFTNTVTVTDGGLTWPNCHVCTVTRPSFAVGRTCVDKEPNEVFGGTQGFDFGSMPVFVGGVPAFTGVITNKNNSAKWIRVESGFVKEKSW